ncbi:MAG: hypothetical protein IKT47_09225 [Oscillospiraceae bacterium]|nr:hypothetical protein [Oscillospiraceae bacterium]
MIENDTVKLLRECDAGIKMGVSSINDVIDGINDRNFKSCLSECRREHKVLENEVNSLLDKYGDTGKEPNFMAKTMSHMKTEVKMGWDNSDATAADLLTDGCNMGVKSLNRYLNQYKAADEVSKDITKRLINLEQQLSTDIRQYL